MSDLERIMELVNKHDETLYGNGKEGLTTKIAKNNGLLRILVGLNISIFVSLVLIIVGFLVAK